MIIQTHSAVVRLVIDDQGGHAVVDQADDIIWIIDELIETATAEQQPAIPGGLEIDGQLLTFGTEGEGLGRLTYRIIGHRHNGYTVAERLREDGPDAE